jgi:MMPL family
VSAFVIWWPWVRTSHILLVPRLRQEVAAHRAVEGVARAVGRTGGVIISCRLVMACVFLVRPVLVPAWHSSSGALVAGLRPDSAAPSSRTDRPARARAVRAIGEGRGEPDLTARRGPDALESLASAWWLETVGVSAKTVGSHH